MEEIFEWYDGPLVWTISRPEGQYICCALDAYASICALVTPEEINEYRDGKRDLRSMFVGKAHMLYTEDTFREFSSTEEDLPIEGFFNK